MNFIITSAITLGILLLGVSCKDDESGIKVSAEQSAAVQDASTSEAYFNDASDMSTTVVAKPENDQFSGGRTAGTVSLTISGDTRFNGAQITLVSAGNITIPRGVITIDFGAGQTDGAGTVRKGIISIAYQGWRFVKDSYYVISFVNYSINGVKVEGIRKVTVSSLSASSVTFDVIDAGGKLTFTDGTTATRESSHTRTWVKGTTILNSQWQVEGTAGGTTRDGKTYVFVTSKALLFKVECAASKIYIASEGEGVFTIDKLPITLNYGASGAVCDNIVTVTIAGSSQDVTVN